VESTLNKIQVGDAKEVLGIFNRNASSHPGLFIRADGSQIK
jgi:hypothetical protein